MIAAGQAGRRSAKRLRDGAKTDRHPCDSKPIAEPGLCGPKASGHSSQHQTQADQPKEKHWVTRGALFRRWVVVTAALPDACLGDALVEPRTSFVKKLG